MSAPLRQSLPEQEIHFRVIHCIKSMPPRYADLLKYMLVFRQQTERKLCRDCKVFNFPIFAKQLNERLSDYGLEVRKLSSSDYPDHSIWQLVGTGEG